MLTSVRWMNDYLEPPASADEQADLATRAGFPLEDRETVALDGEADIRQDFEMLSSRGDCVSHLGLAREIAALSGRTLKTPPAAPPTGGAPAADAISVTNREHDRCPLYTARVIRGVKVGPSPAWLADRLRARGDIPRNNVVDATNFVLFEMGQPTHVFDLAKLKGPEIIVRMAKAGEPFLPIGEGEQAVKLVADDLVIADAESAVALAGVKGGALSAVSSTTTDIILEAATFDPVSVRNTSRRHGIGSDSSYRFERGVHPGQIRAAADRLAAVILDVAGGTLAPGVVEDGAAIPAPRTVSMRTERCRALLGVPMDDREMAACLDRLGFAPALADGVITCTVPVHRLDVEREVDVVEEVARMYGLDNIPVRETIALRIAPPQPTEQARQAVANELVGMGFVETITHALVADDAATPFLPPGARGLRVDDDRARAEPVLQPSLIPSLARVRRHNLDNGVAHLRLFQHAATFWRTDDGHREVVRLGMLMDMDDPAAGLRPMRGAVERLVQVVGGVDATVEVADDTETAWLAPGTLASTGGTPIGRFGVLAAPAAARLGLDQPVLVAELELTSFFERYPPETEAKALPAFPSIERDLSFVVDESVRWADVASLVHDLDLDHLDAVEFVTTFRGKQIPAGRKSLTLRMRFRAPDRTLTHDEVDPQVAKVVASAAERLGAQVR